MKNRTIKAIAAASLLMSACAKSPQADLSATGQINILFETSTETLDITRVLTAPDASEFSLSILSTDNTYLKSWDNILLYPAENKLPIGSYVATAMYGDTNVEGYDKPCFAATSPFDIATDKITDVELTARLANTAVNISYTDAFKNYFTQFSTTLVKPDETFEIANDETRTLYIAPEDFTVKVSYIKPNGKSGSASVSCTGVKGQQWYNISFDVNNGGVGSAEIAVTLNDEVITQDVNIDIIEGEGN